MEVKCAKINLLLWRPTNGPSMSFGFLKRGPRHMHLFCFFILFFCHCLFQILITRPGNIDFTYGARPIWPTAERMWIKQFEKIDSQMWIMNILWRVDAGWWILNRVYPPTCNFYFLIFFVKKVLFFKENMRI